ncbi:unnamed protein product [Ixodes pacificus]
MPRLPYNFITLLHYLATLSLYQVAGAVLRLESSPRHCLFTLTFSTTFHTENMHAASNRRTLERIIVDIQLASAILIRQCEFFLRIFRNFTLFCIVREVPESCILYQ